jgi:hypothetical protein
MLMQVIDYFEGPARQDDGESEYQGAKLRTLPTEAIC